ncbi:MAG: acetyl-CoA C-acetyltransferase [Gemmatimonadetes bacterium]|nr:acetyl-CoA C-acetyltransferase [Gemmatimonadota bacterium]
MNPVAILSAVRTPIGRFLGSLADVPARDLGITAARAALERARVDPGDIRETIFGMARQAGNGPNPARQVGIGAGVPDTAPAYTVHQACASGLKAVALGAAQIAAEEADLVLAGGMESMTRVPYLLERARLGYRLGDSSVVDGMYRDGFHCPLADELMGATAETLADRHHLSRKDQDEFAAESQRRAAAAWDAGRFDDEIVPVEVSGRRGAVTFARDEHPRADTTPEKLAKLPAVFRKDGTVHAGNSSGITDGAAAVVLASEALVKDRGWKPLAWIASSAAAGVDPRVMGIGPVPSTRRVLERLGWKLRDVDLIELNEAFAAQVLAVAAELKIDPERMNVNGGAIALGHPIGATGARILTTLVHEMKRRDAARGIATLCVSGGMGFTMAVTGERPDA